MISDIKILGRTSSPLFQLIAAIKFGLCHFGLREIREKPVNCKSPMLGGRRTVRLASGELDKCILWFPPELHLFPFVPTNLLVGNQPDSCTESTRNSAAAAASIIAQRWYAAAQGPSANIPALSKWVAARGKDPE